MSSGTKPNRADPPPPAPHPAWADEKLKRTLADHRLTEARRRLRAHGARYGAAVQYVDIALKLPLEERAVHHENLPRALRDVLQILSDEGFVDAAEAVASNETWGQTVTRLMNTLSISYEDAVVRALELREPSTTARQVEAGPETRAQAITRLMNHEHLGFEAACAHAKALGFR